MSHLHAHFEFLSVHSPLIQNDLYHIEDVFRYFLEGLRNLRISDENDIQFDSGSRMPCIDKHHHSHSGKKWLCGILERYKMWWIVKWSKKYTISSVGSTSVNEQWVEEYSIAGFHLDVETRHRGIVVLDAVIGFIHAALQKNIVLESWKLK